MVVVVIVIAVVLTTMMLCCVKVASDADDAMERMMAEKDSE